MKTRTWIFLITGLFALCLGLSAFLLLSGGSAAYAEISSQGRILQIVDLRLDQELLVTTPQGGRNLITVRDGKVAVTDANCADQICVKRGFCSGGTQIVCLPNRLVIRFLEQSSIDAVTG